MIKKLLSAAVLVTLCMGANAQQLKMGKAVQSPASSQKLGHTSVASTIETLKPASVMPGGCAVSTNTVVNGLWNYVNDVSAPMDSGYVFGTGIIPLGGGQSTICTELAQKYNVTGAATVTDVLVLAGVAHGGTVTTTAKIYSEASGTHKPNTQIGTTSTAVPMSAYTTTAYTAFHFTVPVPVSAGNFFASVSVPAFGTADHDTLSILSTSLGNCPAAGADSASALKLGAPINSWYLVKVGFGANSDLMIFPVINMVSGIQNYVTKGDISLYAASPNPASSSININFSLNNSASKVEIEVYDVTGKVVKTIKANDFTPGKNSITVDLSNLESGSYMYSITANSTKMFSKFVVTK